MNKKIAMWIAAILLIVLCFSLAACSKKPTTDPIPSTTDQPADTTIPETTGNDSTQATETTQGATDAQHGTDSTQPSLESSTEVGSGRVEGSSSSQQQTTPPVTEPTVTNPTVTDPTVTDPTVTNPPITNPPASDPTTETQPEAGPTLNYQQYMDLDGAEQQKLFDKYFSDDPLAFAAWFQKIKSEYEDGKVEIEATGPVDLEDYIKP